MVDFIVKELGIWDGVMFAVWLVIGFYCTNHGNVCFVVCCGGYVVWYGRGGTLSPIIIVFVAVGVLFLVVLSVVSYSYFCFELWRIV